MPRIIKEVELPLTGGRTMQVRAGVGSSGVKADKMLGIGQELCILHHDSVTIHIDNMPCGSLRQS